MTINIIHIIDNRDSYINISTYENCFLSVRYTLVIIDEFVYSKERTASNH